MKDKKEDLEELYKRHDEVVDTGQAFNRRDFLIFKRALENDLKKISKLASQERQHFGAGNFSELEDYIEHLQRKVDATLEPEMVLTTSQEYTLS